MSAISGDAFSWPDEKSSSAFRGVVNCDVDVVLGCCENRNDLGSRSAGVDGLEGDSNTLYGPAHTLPPSANNPHSKDR